MEIGLTVEAKVELIVKMTIELGKKVKMKPNIEIEVSCYY